MKRFPSVPGSDVTKFADYAALVTYWNTLNLPFVELGLNQGSEGAGTKTVYKLAIGNPSAPAVYINGGIHGAHEWHSPVSIARFFAKLKSPPSKLFAALANRLYWVSIPCVNPHAYAQTWTLNARGVNLNRNFDVDWNSYDDSGEVGSKGTAPFSEIETQYVRDTILATKPVLVLDFHTWGGYEGRNLAFNTSQLGFWKDAERNYRLNNASAWSLDVATALKPTTVGWAMSQTFDGLKVVACTAEPGSLNASTDIDTAFQNILVTCGLKAIEYASRRSSTLELTP